MIEPTISPHDPGVVVEHCDMTGAYITTDGGRSWRMFNLRGVAETFAFDPQDPDVIYAGNMALWRSEDRGRTWSMLLPDPARGTVEHTTGDHGSGFFASDDDRVDAAGIRVEALAVDPADSKRLYMVLEDEAPAVWLSEDRGETWSDAGTLAGRRVNAISARADGLCVVSSAGVDILVGGEWEHREGPSGGRIQYAAVGSGPGAEPRVYVLTAEEEGWEPYCESAHVSEDGGKTWREVTQQLVAALPTAEEGTSYTFRAIACAAESGETAYVGFCRYGRRGSHAASGSGVSSVGIANSGIAKTEDGGESWQLVFDERGRPADNLTVSWVEGRGPDYSIWLDAPVSVGVAPSDGGVCYATDLFRTYRTLDGGKTWETVNSVDLGDGRWTTRGLDVTTCYGVHFDPFDQRRIAISYTDIGMFRSEDGGRSWIGATEGISNRWRNTTYWIEFDPEVEGLIWGVFSGVHDLPRPKMWRDRGVSRYSGGAAVSRDGGRSWTLSNEGMPETAATHIVLDPTSPVGERTLYVCGYGRGVYKSTDDGKSWELKNAGIEGEEPFAWRLTRADDGTLYLVVARRSDDGRIGDEEDGALYTSTDGAESWTRMRLPEGVNGPNGLAVDPNDGRRLYLAAWGRSARPDDVSGGLYLSTDGGESWREVFGGSQHVYDVTIDPRDPSVLYLCGFDSAAYRSTDRGESWERIRGYNFKWGHRVIPDPSDPEKVYITTFGGSVWHGPAAGDPKAAEDIATPVPQATEMSM